MNDLHHLMLLEYLMRITNDLELRLHHMYSNWHLNKMDAVDIIELIETRAAYQKAVEIEKDIIRILSWK